MKDIQVIGFDADDTLWINETYFLETEKKFCALLSAYTDASTVSSALFRTEIQNMPLYGYGVKAYILSIMETAIRISKGNISPDILQEIISLGKEQLRKPVTLLPGVEHTLSSLHGKYKLIVATKGDLLDQENKLIRSGLEHYFHHVEIMSDKTDKKYRKLLHHLDIRPEQFLMIGNSVKSDILPPLALGSHAIYVPFETTWMHEQVEEPQNNPRFLKINSIEEILQLLPFDPAAV